MCCVPPIQDTLDAKSTTQSLRLATASTRLVAAAGRSQAGRGNKGKPLAAFGRSRQSSWMSGCVSICQRLCFDASWVTRPAPCIFVKITTRRKKSCFKMKKETVLFFWRRGCCHVPCFCSMESCWTLSRASRGPLAVHILGRTDLNQGSFVAYASVASRAIFSGGVVRCHSTLWIGTSRYQS